MVESYLYGEPLTGDVNGGSTAYTTNGTTTKSTQTTANDLVVDNNALPLSSTEAIKQDTIIEGSKSSKSIDIMPQVDTNSHKSSYSLLKERYATNYPSFWNSIQKVRKYFLLNNMYLEMDKMNTLLLSNDEQKIGALMQEIAQHKNWNTVQLLDVFLRYIK